jgi:hypothetical protein
MPATPDTDRELRAIDAALAGRPVDAEHAELAELVREVRDGAPPISPAFETRLERRVLSGFPRKPGGRTRRRGGLLVPAVGLACSAVVAVSIGVGVSGDSGGDDAALSRGAEGGGGALAQQAEPARTPPPPGDEAAAGRSAPPGAANLEGFSSEARPLARDLRERALAPGRRMVERDAAIDLTTPADDFAETTEGVLRVADDSGTIVQRSSVSERDGRGYAAYELRVPVRRLDAVLAELSRLADVKSRRMSGNDVTAPYVSARDRLDDARAERRALLRALARADTPNETASLRARLRLARWRVAQAERDAALISRRAQRARVAVTVQSTGESGTWTPGDALRDAGRVLEVALGIGLVVLAVLAPFALLGALAAAAARVGRRRRREAALDGAG